MYVALRDLRFARGEFVLIGSVVALITVLVGFLSGLTGGARHPRHLCGARDFREQDRLLGPNRRRSRCQLLGLGAHAGEQASAWAVTDGVTAVEPLGISQTRSESGDTRAAIALFGVQPGFDATSPTGDGRLGLSEPAAAALQVEAGDEVAIAGVQYTVETVEGDGWYSHTPVVQMTR